MGDGRDLADRRGALVRDGGFLANHQNAPQTLRTACRCGHTDVRCVERTAKRSSVTTLGRCSNETCLCQRMLKSPWRVFRQGVGVFIRSSILHPFRHTVACTLYPSRQPSGRRPQRAEYGVGMEAPTRFELSSALNNPPQVPSGRHSTTKLYKKRPLKQLSDRSEAPAAASA